MKTFLRNFRYMQYFSAICGAISSGSTSAYSTWSSPSIPKLVTGNSPIKEPLSSEDISWISSCYFLGIVPGSVLAGLLIDRIGRKKSILWASIILLIPWIVIAFTKFTWVLITARCCAGMGAAIIMSVLPIYIGEVTEKDIRGRLATMETIFDIFGSVIILSVGPFISYQNLSIVGAMFPLVTLLSFALMPDSPYYLVKVSNYESAAESLAILSSKSINDETVKNELDAIKKTVEHDMMNKVTMKELLTNKQYRKSFLIALGLRITYFLSGIFAINSYMQTILDLSGSRLSSEMSSIIYGVIQFPSVLLSAFLVDKLGRKPLFIFSTFACGFALTCLGAFFYMKDILHKDLSHLYWFPIFGLTLYISMMPVGLSTVSHIMFGELFSTNVKSVAVFIMPFLAGIFTFTSTKIFNSLVEAFGVYAVFWIFAIICFLGTLFGVIVVPETKNKTLQEIQALLNKK